MINIINIIEKKTMIYLIFLNEYKIITSHIYKLNFIQKKNYIIFAK